MDSGPVVVDISSDEDEDNDFGLGKLGDGPYDWISKLLDSSDGEMEGFDDIMVVDEFSTPAIMQKENRDSLKPTTGVPQDAPDDDCLVLDGDPDKPVTVNDNKGDARDGSYDLLIVGEKGQIACRDFPHSRHLCANFPFSTTPHEKYCNSCHCYVCDSPAPCTYWGIGVSRADHCHSTDKDAIWKAQRQSFRRRNMATSQLPKLPNTTPSTMPPLPLPPFRNPAPIGRPNPASLPIPPSKQTPLRPCSITSTDAPYLLTQRHHQRPVVLPHRAQRVGQHPTKSQPPIPGAQYAQRERHCVGALALPVMQSHPKFKRSGTTGSGLMSSSTNRSRYSISSHNQINRTVPQKPHYPLAASVRPQHRPITLQRSQCPPARSQEPQYPSVTSVEDDIRNWQDILVGVASELGAPDSNSRSMAEVQPYTVSSQRPAFGSQFLSQTNATQDMGLYPHSSSATIVPDPLDAGCCWLDGTTTQNFPEQVRVGDPQLSSVVQPSNAVVSGSNPVSEETHLKSIFAAVEEGTVAEAGKEEPGLPRMDPNMLLYDFEDTWSGLAQV